MTEEKNTELMLMYAIKNCGWSHAFKGHNEVKGMIIGEADFIKYHVGEFPDENWEIFINDDPIQ